MNYQQQTPYGFNAPSMPYMPNYGQQPATPSTNVSWVYVNGINGARNQIVQPSQTSWMMDNNEPIIYVKSVDGMGTATLKAFRLTEIPSDRPAENANTDTAYAYKSDLDAIIKRMNAIEEALGGLNT